MRYLPLCRRGGRPHTVVFDETDNKFLKVRWYSEQGSIVLPTQDPSIQVQSRIESFLQNASSKDSEVYRFLHTEEFHEPKSREVRTLKYEHTLIHSYTP